MAERRNKKSGAGRDAGEELALITRCRDGDDEAVSALIEKYKPLVIKLSLARFLPGGDRDDLIQEGMIGLYKAVKQYDPSRDASFYTFASLVIDRQMANAIEISLRDKNRPLNQSVSIDDDMTAGLADDEGNFEDLLIESMVGKDLISRVKGKLSAFELEVMGCILEGMTYREAAKKLKRSPKSVDNAISRIRIKMRELGSSSRNT